jgi:hypothetical protein
MVAAGTAGRMSEAYAGSEPDGAGAAGPAEAAGPAIICGAAVASVTEVWVTGVDDSYACAVAGTPAPAAAAVGCASCGSVGAT